jgi:hypothetical protein
VKRSRPFLAPLVLLGCFSCTTPQGEAESELGRGSEQDPSTSIPTAGGNADRDLPRATERRGSGRRGSGRRGATIGNGGAAGAGPAAEPFARIVGRTVQSASGERFAWPGVHFIARFEGSSASIVLRDGSNQNRFTVVVDDGAPTVFTTSAGQESYALASDLSPGTHEVVVWRNTDSYEGTTEFGGFAEFGSEGELLGSALLNSRRSRGTPRRD